MRAARTTISIIVLSAIAAPTFSAPILDQRYEPMHTNVSAVVGINEGANPYHISWAQVFTVGIAGQLTSVEALLWAKTENPEPLTIDIRTAPGGVPTEADAGANVLASITVPVGDFQMPGTFWHSFDFSAFNLHVAVGDTLAIVLRSEAPTVNQGFEWAGTNGDQFADGSAWPRTTGGFSTNGLDMSFRTFVDTVPTPGALAPLALAGLLGLRRKR